MGKKARKTKSKRKKRNPSRKETEKYTDSVFGKSNKQHARTLFCI